MSITANLVDEWAKDVIYHSQHRQGAQPRESPTGATLFDCYRRRNRRQTRSARRV